MGNVERRELPPRGFVEYETHWLEDEVGRALQSALVRDLTWEQRDIVLFGKRILQPRLIAWAGDLPYRYSGQTLETRAPTPALRDLMARVSARTREATDFGGFNHVLVNRYRDQDDSMGMHSDDEPELGQNPVVATLSLGDTRRFVLAKRGGKGDRCEHALAHGSLLIMGGDCQAHYRHGVPRSREPRGERLSLTFRRVLSVPG